MGINYWLKDFIKIYIALSFSFILISSSHAVTDPYFSSVKYNGVPILNSKENADGFCFKNGFVNGSIEITDDDIIGGSYYRGPSKIQIVKKIDTIGNVTSEVVKVPKLAYLNVLKSLICVENKDTPSRNIFFASQKYKTTLETWSPDHFTDPANFDPKNFTFIYTSIAAWNWGYIESNSFTYKIMADPNFIAQNSKISASVISDNNRHTFNGEIGLILDVPISNFIFTANSDVGSPAADANMPLNDFYQLMRGFLRVKGSLNTLSNIMSHSNTVYNEIGLMGTEPIYGDRIKVKAVVIGAHILNCFEGVERRIDRLTTDNYKIILKKCGFADNIVDLMLKLKTSYPVLFLNI
jgi:hypothetical protein